MSKDVRIVIGSTIGIIALLIILGRVFHVDVQYGLGFIGFVFLIALPTYIYYRKHKDEQDSITTGRLNERLRDASDEIEEIQDSLDDSIEKFREWGLYIKEYDKTIEKSRYADRALKKEVGLDTGGISAEYGQDVTNLIHIRRKLADIRYAVEFVSSYGISLYP
jgi:ABC-type multidrug transport system fused ATPase/permease subunit